jgi:hypothetical protein
VDLRERHGIRIDQLESIDKLLVDLRRASEWVSEQTLKTLGIALHLHLFLGIHLKERVDAVLEDRRRKCEGTEIAEQAMDANRSPSPQPHDNGAQ